MAKRAEKTKRHPPAAVKRWKQKAELIASVVPSGLGGLIREVIASNREAPARFDEMQFSEAARTLVDEALRMRLANVKGLNTRELWRLTRIINQADTIRFRREQSEMEMVKAALQANAIERYVDHKSGRNAEGAQETVSSMMARLGREANEQKAGQEATR